MTDNGYKIQGPSSGRQFAIAVFFALLVATIAYKITESFAVPTLSNPVVQARGAYILVYVVTTLAGGAAYLVATRIYIAIHARQYRKTLDPPEARVVSETKK